MKCFIYANGRARILSPSHYLKNNCGTEILLLPIIILSIFFFFSKTHALLFPEKKKKNYMTDFHQLVNQTPLEDRLTYVPLHKQRVLVCS